MTQLISEVFQKNYETSLQNLKNSRAGVLSQIWPRQISTLNEGNLRLVEVLSLLPGILGDLLEVPEQFCSLALYP